MPAPDPRPLRTQRRLLDAIIALAETRDLSTVSVSEIARAANIDRGTFYLHYADKGAFMNAVISMLLEEFEEMGSAFEKPAMYEQSGLRLSEIPSLYKVIGKHPALYRQFLGKSGSSDFYNRLQAQMEAQFVRLFQVQDPPTICGTIPLSVRARFATSGLLGFVTLWLEECNEDEIDTYTWWAWELLTSIGLQMPVMIAEE